MKNLILSQNTPIKYKVKDVHRRFKYYLSDNEFVTTILDLFEEILYHEDINLDQELEMTLKINEKTYKLTRTPTTKISYQTTIESL
jgi:hypothetical protein